MNGSFAHGTVPTFDRICKLVRWMEDAYDVSLKFWISLDSIDSQSPLLWVYVAGTGAVFDIVPSHLGFGRALVVHGMSEPFYSAMWTAATNLESTLRRWMKPHSPPPSL